MPSEKQLRQLITEIVGTQGWITWFAPRVKYRKQQDIFTIWDGLYAKGNEVRFIQFTTKSNKSSHIKKIKNYMRLYGLSHRGELWCYDNKRRDFEISYV